MASTRNILVATKFKGPLSVVDTGGSNGLILKSNESLTGPRTLNLIVGDTDRTVSLGGGLTTGGTFTTGSTFSTTGAFSTGGPFTTAAAFTTSGANALTLTTTASTNVTLPTTGTLSTLAGTETLSNKTLSLISGITTSSPGFNIALKNVSAGGNGQFTISQNAINHLVLSNTYHPSNPVSTDFVLNCFNDAGGSSVGIWAGSYLYGLGGFNFVLNSDHSSNVTLNTKDASQSDIYLFTSSGKNLTFSGSISISGSSSGTTTIAAQSAASGTWSLPASTDTFVGIASEQELSNKTLVEPILNSPVYTLQVSSSTGTSGSPQSILPSSSGAIFTNQGVTEKAYVVLPSASAGLVFTFYCQDSDGYNIAAASGDTIRINGTVSAGAGSADTTTVGSLVKLLAINSTEWIDISSHGTWTVT